MAMALMIYLLVAHQGIPGNYIFKLQMNSLLKKRKNLFSSLQILKTWRFFYLIAITMAILICWYVLVVIMLRLIAGYCNSGYLKMMVKEIFCLMVLHFQQQV